MDYATEFLIVNRFAQFNISLILTVALCGLFLFLVPIPLCKKVGEDLMKAGVALAVEGYVNRQEDEEKDKKK